MGIEHSSGAGTGRSPRSDATTTTTRPTVDGTGRANNHYLVHFGRMGYLCMYPAFAPPSESTTASASCRALVRHSCHFRHSCHSYLYFGFLGSMSEIGIPASSFGTSSYTWYGQLPINVRLLFPNVFCPCFGPRTILV